MDQAVTVGLSCPLRRLFLDGSRPLRLLFRPAPHHVDSDHRVLRAQLFRSHGRVLLVRLRALDLDATQGAEVAGGRDLGDQGPDAQAARCRVVHTRAAQRHA